MPLPTFSTVVVCPGDWRLRSDTNKRIIADVRDPMTNIFNEMGCVVIINAFKKAFSEAPLYGNCLHLRFFRHDRATH